MPIYRQKIDAGNQFTGADASTGLFIPGNNGNTGSSSIQVFVRSLRFHCKLATPTFTLSGVDPTDADNDPVIFSDTQNDLTMEGMILATEPTANGEAWGLRFVTTGMTGDGWLVIDYDFVATEG